MCRFKKFNSQHEGIIHFQFFGISKIELASTLIIPIHIYKPALKSGVLKSMMFKLVKALWKNLGVKGGSLQEEGILVSPYIASFH